MIKGKWAFISVINICMKHKMWKLELRMQSRGKLNPSDPSWFKTIWQTNSLRFQPCSMKCQWGTAIGMDASIHPSQAAQYCVARRDNNLHFSVSLCMCSARVRGRQTLSPGLKQRLPSTSGASHKHKNPMFTPHLCLLTSVYTKGKKQMSALKWDGGRGSIA